MKNFDKVLEDIKYEIIEQDVKWGADRRIHPFQWNTILTEEVGEYAQTALHTEFGGKESGRSYYEIIQVAAVAMQIANDLLLLHKDVENIQE